MEMVNSFKKTIIENVPKMVIKYNDRAKQFETVDSRRNADVYIAARLSQDSFLTYKKFSLSSLIKAGIPESEAQAMVIDKNKIPLDRRDLVIKYEREKVIVDYIELNNYYRQLNGLPDVDDTDYVYLEDFEYEDYGIPNRIPVHEIDPRILASIDLHGIIIPRLVRQHPTKKYLEHLGLRKIDILNARMASNFELLYFPRHSAYNTFYKDFVMTYDESREYFLTVIYNIEFSRKYESYDEFIAFSILIMTIQRLISYLFKTVIYRDFYDVETLRVFLESYNIPFIKAFTTSQLQLLVKNLNILINNKSTNTVLYDILDILGFGEFNLNKFYLFKQHKMTGDDEPYFPYKTITDEEGHEIKVLDKEAMYDFYFIGVNVKNDDIQSALDESIEKEDYEIFTRDDDTWIHDQKLLDKLIEDDFNYVDSKYMNINVMYKLYEMTFEITYISRMLIDKKEETSKITVDLPKISSVSINLFDMIVVLICLLCKKLGTKPVLMTSPSKILTVRGFNFELDFEEIRKDIAEHHNILDQRLLEYMYNTPFKTPKDVNDMFVNVREFEELIIELLDTTTNYRAYRAYKKLYDTVMNIRLNNEVYNLKDGTTPATFMDYLKEYLPEVHTTIELMEKTEATEYIDYIISKMGEMFEDTQYLRFINSIDVEMMDGVLRILRFFKSYTIDIRDMTVIYLMDSKYYNTVKFFDAITHWKVNLNLSSETVMRHYDDFLHNCVISVHNYSTINPYDWTTFKGIIKHCASLYLHGVSEDVIGKFKVDLLLSDKYIEPVINKATCSFIAKMSDRDYYNFHDYLKRFLVTIPVKDRYPIFDNCVGIMKSMTVVDRLDTYDYTLIERRVNDLEQLMASILRANENTVSDNINHNHIESNTKVSSSCCLGETLTIIR